MLTPEQKTALANAEALISEIKSMEAGEGQEDEELKEAIMALNKEEQMGEQPEGEDIEKEEEEEEEGTTPPEKPSKVVKDTTTIGKPDASTASSDAEDIVDDQPDQSKENLDEIAKSLAVLVKAIGRKNVKKSQGGSRVEEVLVGLTKVIKAMQDDQAQQRAALNDIFEGLNLAKPLEQSYNTNVHKSRKPVQTTDTNAVLTEVAKSLKTLLEKQVTKEEVGQEGNSGFVRKSLSDIMTDLFQQ